MASSGIARHRLFVSSYFIQTPRREQGNSRILLSIDKFAILSLAALIPSTVLCEEPTCLWNERNETETCILDNIGLLEKFVALAKLEDFYKSFFNNRYFKILQKLLERNGNSIRVSKHFLSLFESLEQ